MSPKVKKLAPMRKVLYSKFVAPCKLWCCVLNCGHVRRILWQKSKPTRLRCEACVFHANELIKSLKESRRKR